MEATATTMQDEKAMCLSNLGRPRSCREKFIHKWNEKLKLQQQSLSSPQVPECQAAIDMPTQGQMTRGMTLSLRKASLQPSENAVYILTVSSASQEQQHVSPDRSLATEHSLQQRPMAFYQTGKGFLDEELASKLLNQETNTEEEFVQICTSDLLLEGPVKNRPRLLPPNRKMHVEVRKKPIYHLLQDSARSPISLQYNPPLITMSITNPSNIPGMESIYCRFPSNLEKQDSYGSDRPGYQPAECPPPGWGINAPPSEEAVRNTDRLRQKQHQPFLGSLKRAPSLDPEVATKSSIHTYPLNHLPPKKRYTQGRP